MHTDGSVARDPAEGPIEMLHAQSLRGALQLEPVLAVIAGDGAFEENPSAGRPEAILGDAGVSAHLKVIEPYVDGEKRRCPNTSRRRGSSQVTGSYCVLPDTLDQPTAPTGEPGLSALGCPSPSALRSSLRTVLLASQCHDRGRSSRSETRTRKPQKEPASTAGRNADGGARRHWP